MFSRLILRVVVSSFKMRKTAAVSKQCFTNNLSTNNTSSVCTPRNSSTAAIYRFYSRKPETMPTVDFEYVRKATTNNNVLIVDVREADEIKDHGKIPNSINIPLGNVTTALSQLSDKEFAQTYQRPKPTENTEIIFYCMIGKRSGKAQSDAQTLGFKNAKNYLGSFNDWAEKVK